MNDEQFFQIAFSKIPGLGAKNLRTLLDDVGSPEVLFDKQLIQEIPNLPLETKQALLNGSLLKEAEKELKIMDEKGIKALFVLSDDYPYRLRECEDAPIVLYCYGNSNLNAAKMLAVVGTRRATPLGKESTQLLVKDLSMHFKDLLIVSGLAYGIDVISHQAAMQHGLKTIGVLAHGLQEVYPHSHRRIADEMVINGGTVLSEYPWGIPSLPYRFRERNRIIAGLCDACIVVESTIDGGSMITARFARDYNRDVMLFPGRNVDALSSGCNDFIKQRSGALIESAADVIREMNWPLPKGRKVRQQLLFAERAPLQKEILDGLGVGNSLTMQELATLTGLKVNELQSQLLDLEMDGLIECLPGCRFRRRSL